MWICLNDGFVSIVQVHDQPERLLVRARRREHLRAFLNGAPDHTKAFLKGAKIATTPGHDYRFRVVLPRGVVAELLAARVLAIDYGNFKDSVKEPKLHHLYSTWLGQPSPPAAGGSH